MRIQSDWLRVVMLAGLFGFVLLSIGSARADTVSERVETLRIPAEAGIVFVVENLAGDMRLEPAGGNDVVIEARIQVHGRDANDARQRLDEIGIVSSETDRRITVGTRYAKDRGRDFVYARPGWREDGETRTRYRGRKLRVFSKRGGKRQEVYVDYTVRIPRGTAMYVENAVGRTEVEGVDADLRLGQHVGPVRALNGSGRLAVNTGSGSVVIKNHLGPAGADTGSGSVSVSEVRGDVSADTGSGPVDISNVQGNVHADTGSGQVTVNDAFGEILNLDTGSGAVLLRNVAGSVRADTGSGRVTIENLNAGARLELDTGSGGVRVTGDLSALRDMIIETGSGGVYLETRSSPSMELVVEGRRGRIEIDLPGMRNVRSTNGSFFAVIGSGDGRGRIDAGGPVVFTTSR